MAQVNNPIYINSYNIKVYPSAKREDGCDRNAKLTTEQNLVNIINRLTSLDAFIINGLNITDNTTNSSGITISSGSCNIHGYYFNISEDINIDSNSLGDDNQYIYFGIGLKTSNSFEELIAIDDSNDSSLLDSGDGDDHVFKGLQILLDKDELENYYDDTNKIFHFYLPIAKKNNGKWTSFISNDNQNGKNRWTTQKFSANDILVKANRLESANEFYHEKQDLMTWLQYNFVIDDGRVKNN